MDYVPLTASEKRVDASIKHYLKISSEDFDHRFGLVKELIDTRPTRDEVRLIVKEEVREELRPIRAEMQMYREELLDHRTSISRLERSNR